ncbi:MAG TPA: glycosyltransferase 87 family protein [Chthoniobacterales bacterium]|nr:glycosyltransferase 87 family protein [Chthoniobacterales bacterium]
MTGHRWYSTVPVWFWSVVALGAGLRLYLVFFSQGTYDVGFWQLHAMRVNEMGLLAYYHSSQNANHPPFILEFASYLLRFAEWTGIPFRILLRAPIATLDGASAFLLLKLLKVHPWRFALTAAFWINPLAIILSAYQGNTDSTVAFVLLLVAWLLSRRQSAAAAIAMGIGFWIKLPAIVALPAFLVYLRHWRQRTLFLFLTAVIGAVGYLPALFQDPAIVATNVFGYHGRMLQTQAGVPAWGPRALFFSVIASPEKWPEQLHAPVLFFLQHDWQIGLLLAIAVIALRWPRRSALGLCATVAMAYTALCGVTDYWAFQYFAWSLPFWFFLRPWFFIPATIMVSAYIYSLYWKLCGNPWLLGTWDFAGNLFWPPIVVLFRDLAVVFFFLAALAFVIASVRYSLLRVRSNRQTT